MKLSSRILEPTSFLTANAIHTAENGILKIKKKKKQEEFHTKITTVLYSSSS